MQIVGVYKIGLAKYVNKADVNSGAFERQLIIDKLSHEAVTIDLNEDSAGHLSNKLFNAILIIGGMISVQDKIAFNMFLEYRAYHPECKLIFIASDIDCINKLGEHINSCDYCLTQTDHKFPSIQVPQLYSYLPELFFRPGIKATKNKNCLHNVFFAGSADGRGDNLMTYLFKDPEFIESRLGTVSLIKSRYFDNRVRYDEQLLLLESYGYTLMIVTEQCRSIGWITSRLFEALSVATIPIFDDEYDTHYKYIGPSSPLRVGNYNEMMGVVKTTGSEGLLILSEYANLISKAAVNNNKFIDLVFTLI
jgi:hypothetical protein